MTPLQTYFFGHFSLRLSGNKCSQVLSMGKFGPTAPDFGYDFWAQNEPPERVWTGPSLKGISIAAKEGSKNTKVSMVAPLYNVKTDTEPRDLTFLPAVLATDSTHNWHFQPITINCDLTINWNGQCIGPNLTHCIILYPHSSDTWWLHFFWRPSLSQLIRQKVRKICEMKNHFRISDLCEPWA